MPAKKIVRSNTQGFDVEAAQANPKAFLDDLLSNANTQQQRTEALLDIHIRFGEITQQVVEIISLAQHHERKSGVTEAWWGLLEPFLFFWRHGHPRLMTPDILHVPPRG